MRTKFATNVLYKVSAEHSLHRGSKKWPEHTSQLDKRLSWGGGCSPPPPSRPKLVAAQEAVRNSSDEAAQQKGGSGPQVENEMPVPRPTKVPHLIRARLECLPSSTGGAIPGTRADGAATTSFPDSLHSGGTMYKAGGGGINGAARSFSTLMCPSITWGSKGTYDSGTHPACPTGSPGMGGLPITW